MNYHDKDCALRHNGTECTCGYVKPLSKKDRVVKAAVAWRKEWIDMEDELEMEGGCKCEICQLVRAIDDYVK